MKIYGNYGYEYSEEFDCFVCYKWDTGWQHIASFEDEDDAENLCKLGEELE